MKNTKKRLLSKKVVPLPSKTSNYRSQVPTLVFRRQLIVNGLIKILLFEKKIVLSLRLIYQLKKENYVRNFE